MVTFMVQGIRPATWWEKDREKSHTYRYSHQRGILLRHVVHLGDRRNIHLA
jgi:hypothetical protein